MWEWFPGNICEKLTCKYIPFHKLLTYTYILSGNSLSLQKVVHNFFFLCVSIKKLIFDVTYVRFLFQFFFFFGDKDEQLMLRKYLTVTIISDGKLQTLNKIL